MVSSEPFQINGKCTTMTFFRLLQVTKIMVHKAQIIVPMRHINMFRSEPFQVNGQCTIITFFCLLQVTKITMHSA